MIRQPRLLVGMGAESLSPATFRPSQHRRPSFRLGTFFEPLFCRIEDVEKQLESMDGEGGGFWLYHWLVILQVPALILTSGS
ncbi:uncharacterized protein BJX67DRAFT_340658 [Aspergillus lucknowensis]|uniref:Uncharacterized protein n=1 Tax=Aspergillus lucknowensis TaxID=176173 RepID=A0ABR4M5D0_9EURO